MSSNEFHYTSQKMVDELLSLVPLQKTDIVVDAGSGKNKIWFNSINVDEKYECEIDDGNDFLLFDKKVDWVVGNPPFSMGWKFVEHSISIANKGIAFLHNLNSWNQYTLNRLNILQENGFYLRHLHITSDPRWFGRYYFCVWMNQNGSTKFTWSRK